MEFYIELMRHFESFEILFFYVYHKILYNVFFEVNDGPLMMEKILHSIPIHQQTEKNNIIFFYFFSSLVRDLQ